MVIIIVTIAGSESNYEEQKILEEYPIKTKPDFSPHSGVEMSKTQFRSETVTGVSVRSPLPGDTVHLLVYWQDDRPFGKKLVFRNCTEYHIRYNAAFFRKNLLNDFTNKLRLYGVY